MMNKFWPVLCAAGSLTLLAACGSGSGKTAGSGTQNQGSVAPVATVTAAATALAAQTPATNPVSRVMGAVTAVSGNKVSLQDGNTFMLDPQTTITRRDPASTTEIQSGRTVAVTAKRQPDNTLLASLVVVFPKAPNGFPLGQRPLEAGDLMTNATVDKADASGFAVSFPGGGAQVKLAPGAQVQILANGTPADIKPGVTVSAAVKDGVAQTVSIQ